MAFTGPLEDRIAIRELHGTYADASFRADKQGWLDCWSEDCLWRTTVGDFRGKQALGERWDKLWQSLTALAFFTETGAIEVDGDRATARCYVHEIFTMGDAPAARIVACYEDKLVREAAGWRFAERAYSILMRDEAG
ncbi:MAG: nuclear transport factor 2 family protein [Sphingomonadaceae bacterium]